MNQLSQAPTSFAINKKEGLSDYFYGIDLNPFDGVFLDFDNTLYEYEPCHRFALNSCYREYKKLDGLTTFIEFELLYKTAQKRIKKYTSDQAASHSRFLYFQSLFETKFGQTECELTIRFENLYWKSFFSQMVLRPGALEFLQKCQSLGKIVCLITDLTAKIQIEKIRFLKIDLYIKFIVSSEEAGQEKPGSRPFELAIKKTGLSPEKILMVGDSFEKDIVGAEKLRIKSFFIKEV